MQDLTGLGKVMDSALANKIYDDGLSKATRESGDALHDFAITFRLFAATFNVLVRERLGHYCERARNAVPPERQIEATPSIAGPILLELRHHEDESKIADLFVNLLSRAIDRDRKDEAHPAFVKIVGQLCPEEAMILHVLKSEPIRLMNRYAKPYLEYHSVSSSNYPVAELQTANRLHMYLNHLESLNMIDYGDDNGSDIKTFPTEGDLFLIPREARLNSFGLLFVKACEP